MAGQATGIQATGAGRTALVLGATGGIGGEMARALAARGWTVRGLRRKLAEAPRSGKGADGIDWIVGDAMNAADVRTAAEGAALIVHAVNPPGYRDWDRLVLPMLDNGIAAACANHARILLPGTVYNYGPDVFPLIPETAAQNPLTRKGAIRVEMERRLHRAVGQGAKLLILRCGDFFGPRAGNNWFSQGLLTPGKPPTRINQPGRPGVGHQWAYLPDVAETAMRLLDREAELGDDAMFHMDGHWDADGGGMVAAIARALGEPGLPVRRMPWWLLRLGGLAVPLLRELSEMRYLWQRPVRLDNRRLLAFLGEEPHTPLDLAVRRSLAGLGHLPGQPADGSEPNRILFGSHRHQDQPSDQVGFG
ncbi:nucleoside-diphosphate-sugar epimerase [Azospirillum lipoferum]|uniref:NAD(P)H-binding protein n=1 Tax=Azospirillum lipoferum TaxID=193 RepID=A0A5A9GC35_AZOLI|nr:MULTISPECIES: NAD(P)H-binding protein [Azospirillum]KAA0592003.1 NAD(P)H-binding protein [Azospirillum lipoferum]MCP1612124.1 nucleoside-diphosphate-sugar epimerase [Azospirillum lipoferum]MDW5536649.1 NAD(P)H-binding protein [Azospirillum sp. NL1]